MANPYPAAFIDQNNEGRLVGELNFTDSWNQPGGSSPSTLSFDATTDANTFLSPAHIFDLGTGPHPVLITMTALALVGDGETFGNDAGTIYGGTVDADGFPGLSMNADGGVHYTSPTSKDVSNWIAAAGAFVFELQANAQVADRLVLGARYLRVQLAIISNDTGLLYAGANHPTAHATIAVTYL